MKIFRVYIVCLLAALSSGTPAFAQHSGKWFAWQHKGNLPLKNGISGALIGMDHGVLIVAGGSSFNKPMAEGGAKEIHDEIYVCLHPDADSLQWIKAGKLPEPVTEAAMANLENGLLCIGGTGTKGPSRRVYRLSWNKVQNTVEVDAGYPLLPQPLTGAAAARLNGKVYVAGGKNDQSISNDFLSLTLTPGTRSEWQKITSWPGPPRFGAALVEQNSGDHNCLFLLGGKYKNGYVEDAYLRDAWRFDATATTNKWKKLADMPRPAMFAAATAYGQSHLLIFSGSDGHQIDSAIAMGPRYSITKSILAYHTLTNTWINAGELPAGLVGAGLVKINNDIRLIGGEIRPGVRVSEVLSGKTLFAMQKSRFGWIDYATIIIYLLVLAGISFYFSRKKTSADDYFRGGQRIPFWAAGISVMATQVSTIGFMSIPAKAYATNWSYISGAFTWFLVVPIVTWAIIPFFRRLDVTSAYEYLERRFNEWVRLFAGVFYCLYQLGRMGLVIYLPAIALSSVAPISTFNCILIMGILSTVYTVVGGIEAVIWIEVLQALLLMGGAIICIILAIMGIHGGVGEFMHVAVTDHKFDLGHLNWDITSAALGVILIGNIFNRLGSLVSDQAIVQRYMTTKNLKEARKSVWMDVAVSLPWALIIYILGTALYVYYKSNPGLLNPTAPTDSILPQFIAQRAPSGLSGLIIAAIFAASMATVESHIHSLATIFTTDFYLRFSKNVTRESQLKFARTTTACLGIAATGLGVILLEVNIKSILDVFTELTGLFIGSAAGLYLLGIFTRRTNSAGALIGAIGSSAILYYVQTQTHINFWLFSAIGFFCCFIIGYLSSFIFMGQKDIQGLTIYTINKNISTISQKTNE